MIGAVSNILGRDRINIMSYDNKSNGTIGYNIIDCAVPVPPKVRAGLLGVPAPFRAPGFSFARDLSLPAVRVGAACASTLESTHRCSSVATRSSSKKGAWQD